MADGITRLNRLCRVDGAIAFINRTGAAVTEVGSDFSDTRMRRRRHSGLKCPLLLGAVNLAQVVDASILLRQSPGVDKIGKGDCSQQSDDSHDNHEFHKRETNFVQGL